MRKLIFTFFGILALCVAVPVHSEDLCSFPFGSYNGMKGGFSVQYDGRFYDSSYGDHTSRPNGGIKLGLELGYWQYSWQRDVEVAKVQSLKYEKHDDISDAVITTHILTKAGKYLFTDRYKIQYHVADYVLWLGEASNAIGKWKVSLSYGSDPSNPTIYTASFEITDDMIESVEPSPIKQLKIERNRDKSFNVCFRQTDHVAEYRVRVFDGSDFIFDSRISDLTTDPICLSPPLPPNYAGKSGRVEVRTQPIYWLLLAPCGAQTGSLHPGFYSNNSRVSTFFTLDED
jgi:hypothetical protein